MSEDISRLKDAILFISQYCKGKLFFGATHINKILYFADFSYYKYTGESITGATYFKLEFGPAPKYLLQAQEELCAEGKLKVVERKLTAKYVQKRPELVGPFDENIIPDLARDIITQIADQCCTLPATRLSEMSHRHLAWKIAELNDPIPYFTIHCTGINPITDSSKNWALELAVREGLIRKSA